MDTFLLYGTPEEKNVLLHRFATATLFVTTLWNMSTRIYYFLIDFRLVMNSETGLRSSGAWPTNY